MCVETLLLVACGESGEGYIPDAPSPASVWEKMMDTSRMGYGDDMGIKMGC